MMSILNTVNDNPFCELISEKLDFDSRRLRMDFRIRILGKWASTSAKYLGF